MHGPSHGDTAMLLLADSRLPAGGHAHSGGAEEAVRVGAITGPEDLARFLRGRLATAGLVTAALAAAACEIGTTVLEPPEEWEDAIRRWLQLDAEADARTSSPAQREASRTQGRLLVRTTRRIWPSAALDSLAKAVPDGLIIPSHWEPPPRRPGAPYQAALAAAHTSVTAPATAAVRLLGLDPVTVHRLLADLAPALNDAAHAACASLIDSVIADTQHDWSALPAHAAPALDLLAEQHLRTEVRLFVS